MGAPAGLWIPCPRVREVVRHHDEQVKDMSAMSSASGRFLSMAIPMWTWMRFDALGDEHLVSVPGIRSLAEPLFGPFNRHGCPAHVRHGSAFAVVIWNHGVDRFVHPCSFSRFILGARGLRLRGIPAPGPS